MEVVVNLFCDSFADSRHALDLGEAGAGNRARGAEMAQQRLLPARADAGDLVEWRGADRHRPAGAVRPDRKPVRLVAQSLQEIKDRVARLEREGRSPRQEESLP